MQQGLIPLSSFGIIRLTGLNPFVLYNSQILRFTVSDDFEQAGIEIRIELTKENPFMGSTPSGSSIRIWRSPSLTRYAENPCSWDFSSSSGYRCTATI